MTAPTGTEARTGHGGAGTKARPAVGDASDASAESDASVVRRSLTDPDVFAELFHRYADDIHRYVARRLGAEAADDLMAETFVVAFQQRRRYDLDRPEARPWLYGIATNLVGGHRRAEARRLRAMSRAAAPDGRGAEGEPLADRVAARVSAEGTRGALAGALAALPARYRDVLLVVAWGDLDYAEAAEALGVPVGTVRSRLHRARKRVRAALGGADPTRTGDVQEEAEHG
ncbi:MULTISPECIES: RNA polymerase sigma factor [unclassified Streptomyces]|nr:MULTISPECIES: RNA polymerase sigma factor [unclassified Streptomyces]MYR67393.1 sigma-70 family RNA polymerase sigma factor [Streptomyces sp. SID4939]MYS01386.1 sigma-70 family RNA polymerase sigma factor [Streptomyces sp. SID4940]MYT61891.1 sigma-70 family RNA polymerase sigma factor [Streptomyces sp. SID8357]MYT85261.1 sigma-70 family RNA polymerase sigma factor [Streptomyces sp. SID8360]MYW39044.1 sigma-70 family RNA polymerase sigma factor [Streptomyces sp. SID1]